jgi:uncharacterized protein (TIGR00369 family)
MSDSRDVADGRGARAPIELLDGDFDESGPRQRLDRGRRAAPPAMGTVHGGLYTTAIETFATLGAYEAVKDRGQQAVGISNVTDFVRPRVRGRLNVIAIAIRQGRTQQLWQVGIRRPDDDKLVAKGQVRLLNVDSRDRAESRTAA